MGSQTVRNDIASKQQAKRESVQFKLQSRASNRFKILDMVDKLPEELWMEICNITQEAVTKTIPRKKKCKKLKWLSKEALQIANERRQVKGKGEREIYTQLNAELQRTARRDTQNTDTEVAQSCPTLCDPMDCSRPGSSVHGIFQE